jgi:hypothetical protein
MLNYYDLYNYIYLSMVEIDNTIFYNNLLLTQNYCELQLTAADSDSDPATALRTFNPIYNGHKLFSYKKGVSCYTGEEFTSVNWSIDPLDRNLLLYPELFEKQLTYKKNRIGSINDNTKFEGRILVAEIDQTVVDGASEVESKGFVDLNDCPPIDTWFYKALTDENWIIFFAWIPKQYIEFADKAVAVNCVDCITWYQDWLLLKKVSSINFKQANSKISFLKHINKLFGK